MKRRYQVLRKSNLRYTLACFLYRPMITAAAVDRVATLAPLAAAPDNRGAGGVGGVVTASGTYQHHTSEAPDDSVVNVNSGLMGVPNVRFKAVPSISILSFRAGRAQAIKY